MRKILFFCAMLFSAIAGMAQVDVKNGPDLENDRDNKMNRMLGGDEKSFYCYRIRSKGRGTSYFVEKYDKATLKPVFSKEIPVNTERLTKVEDVHYIANKIYIFVRNYDKSTDKMTLFYQSVSSEGVISSAEKQIMSINSDHYEFVDFEIFENPSKTKVLVKAFHKADKEDQYKTDFLLLDGTDMKKIWQKKVGDKVGSKTGEQSYSMWFGWGSSEDVGFIGTYLDDKDNIYFASSYYAKNSTEKNQRYKAAVSILKSEDQKPISTELTFEEDYLVKDVEFSMTADNQLVVGGFMKDVIERKGRDLVQVGIFSFKINITDGAIISSAIKMFDDELLTALESSPNKSRYHRYKMDYILHVGDDVFYVGEQYHLKIQTTTNSGSGLGYTTSTTRYIYDYMDVIVAKMNKNGEFEWISNAPLRNNFVLQDFTHVFKEYIAVATDNKIYILNNEHEKNLNIYDEPDYTPRAIRNMNKIHGTNFVYSTIDVVTGKMEHGLIFKNDDYCFAPIQEVNPMFLPPESTEIFIMGGLNEIYVYTEDRGRDRFVKLTLR